MPHDTDRHPLPPGFRWPEGVRAAALFSFDLDAEAVMLGDTLDLPPVRHESPVIRP